MPNNTERKGPSRVTPIMIGVGAVMLLLVLMVLLPILLLWADAAEAFASVVFLVLYTLLGLVLIAGVTAAVVQRLGEIKRGEEEDAKRS